MRKISLVFILSLAVLLPEMVTAQCGRNFIPNFRKGDTDLSFGIGFGSHAVHPGSYSTVPFFAANIDHGLRDDLGPGIVGVGGFLGYEQYKTEFASGEYGYTYSSLVLQARGTYHYQFWENFDTYAGLGLGFRILSSSEYGIHPVDGPEPNSGLKGSAALFAGGRYFFNDNVAAFGEVSIGTAMLTLGVTFRL